MQKLLESYGILIQENIKDINVKINKNTITIHNSNISEIDLNILEQKQINKITIKNCEIDYIYFANDNSIELFFSDCVFKNQIIARGFNFRRKVSFEQCVFEKRIDFTTAIFNSQVDFNLTKFEDEVRFIKAKFLADYTNQENIENNFREAVFKDKTSFAKAEFKARVSFNIARFEGEARFINTKFLAEYTNHENIENNFREAVFKGKTSFTRAELKAKVDFNTARFESEARFINTSFFKNTIIFSEVEFNNVKFISGKKRDTININDTVEQTYLFQNVTFKGIVNFENIHIKDLNFKNVIFNNIVVFDNTTLDSKPKFINCIFSNQFNIKQEHIQYDFKDISKDSNDLTKLPNLENINKNDDFEKPSNLRDLFRKLKSNRIAHHNLIDASELRAQELYARELELKHKKIKNLKDTIEQWQLFFYRKLCDHHTDLALNAKWLVFTIALYILLIGKIWYIYPIALISFFIIDVFLKAKNTSIIISSIIIFITLCNQPKMILAIPNLLSNDFNWWQNLTTSIYIIVFGLIIFSLQKTARKNTIIPN
ncbi:pentapeptide repeat-containing protein [Campylobacter sp. 2014D-0216]|uniref:pentapeptide repeat-containing protein n=1 Tax=Campylobacter sp. 2014D-0216 TaxID=1813595 RepID=UPI0018A6A13C|nr:pentapeptide repeat-containing protein [Campylobacter sp. 2014D-0216]QOR01717.1 pentapeptide repeat-containing protein [Campylobacter sp. 2014D-0216]